MGVNGGTFPLKKAQNPPPHPPNPHPRYIKVAMHWLGWVVQKISDPRVPKIMREIMMQTRPHGSGKVRAKPMGPR